MVFKNSTSRLKYYAFFKIGLQDIKQLVIKTRTFKVKKRHNSADLPYKTFCFLSVTNCQFNKYVHVKVGLVHVNNLYSGNSKTQKYLQPAFF